MSTGAAAGVSRFRQFGINARGTMATLMRPPRRRAAWPSPFRLAVGAGLALLAVGTAMLLLDARSLGEVRQLPPWLVAVAHPITDLGLSGWFLWPLGLALLALGALDSPSMARMPRAVLAALAVRLGFVFTAIAVPGIAVAIVKHLIGRARPFVGGVDPWAYQFFVWRSDHASFPSGHATTAFGAAVAIGAVWPWTRPVMWAYAAVIAASRVVVSAHHPSDVVAGAVFGIVGALLVRNWFAARGLGFVVDGTGTVRALPAPSWARVKAAFRSLRRRAA